MPCRPLKSEDGKLIGMVCGKVANPVCEFCRKRGRKRSKHSTKLCDWKVGDGKTCDAKLCGDCSSSPAPGKDLCPTHAAQWERMRPAWEARRRERERETTNA